MTGISEILVLVFLICLVLIIPRMIKPAKTSPQAPSQKLSTRMRAGVVASILFPGVIALVIRPWEARLVPFLSFGILPVILAWAIVWVSAGKHQKK